MPFEALNCIALLLHDCVTLPWHSAFSKYYTHIDYHSALVRGNYIEWKGDTSDTPKCTQPELGAPKTFSWSLKPLCLILYICGLFGINMNFLFVLRYNGSLPNGDRGRRKSRFALYKRPKANGVKPSTVHVISTPQASKAISCKGQHSISYTLSRNQTVVVEYTHDKDTDMFQVTTPGGSAGAPWCGAVAAPHIYLCRPACSSVPSYRPCRSLEQGSAVENETNILQDGSLIDLCGATLLWRTADGLFHTPTQKHIEALRQEINAARPQCPVGLNTLAFPSINRKDVVEEKQPWAYLSCGHVHGYHNWGHRSDIEANERECPMCRTVGPYVPLWLGCEAGFYVDAGPPTYAFTPCGHVCSEKSAKYWSQIPLPHGTHAFHASCPFCAAQLTGEHNCVKLIFQGPID
uniref:Pellino E3 ubiquitin protein ligase family member 2 n=1 Tax=Chelonoidis abingdonii TaxID=106734 RepID=A0A8C0J3W6_CHEAB